MILEVKRKVRRVGIERPYPLARMTRRQRVIIDAVDREERSPLAVA